MNTIELVTEVLEILRDMDDAVDVILNLDAARLVKELECGIRAGNYEDGYEKYMHINDMDDCVDTVKYFDKADVVEKEKIYKAIDEIIEVDDDEGNR